MPSSWKPLDTLPLKSFDRRGKPFHLKGAWGECLGFWQDEDERKDGTWVREGWVGEGDRIPLKPQPTHWAPVKDVNYDPPPPPVSPKILTVRVAGKNLRAAAWERER